MADYDKNADAEHLKKSINRLKKTEKIDDEPPKTANNSLLIESKLYRCPCCDTEFKERHVKPSGGLSIIGSDTDLRKLYATVDPILYDVVVCVKCGYSSLSKTFHNLSFNKAQIIISQLPSKFKNLSFPRFYTEDMAIKRYRQAVINALLTREKSGEIAYLYMRLAWLYRSKGDTLNELKMLSASYEGFLEAVHKEHFPIIDLDEETTCYLMADFLWRLEKREAALGFFKKLADNMKTSAKIKRLINEHPLIAESHSGSA